MSMARYEVNIDYIKTAPNSDHSSSYESGEDSTGTGVRVSPPSASAAGSHEGYSQSPIDSGEESWVVQDEIGPSDSASRPRTANHHRHIPASRPGPGRRPSSRRQISHERVVTHRPLAHRGPPPSASPSVDSSEEWPAGYARGPPPHHGRTYAHWGHAGPAPPPPPAPGYAASYSSGSGYSQYAPPGPVPPAQQVVPFGGPASYSVTPYHPPPGSAPSYYGAGPLASPPMSHPIGPHGNASYVQDMMHQHPNQGYFPYPAQPYPIPVSMAQHMYPAPYAPVYATPPPISTPAVQTPPPPTPGESSKEKEELAERLAAERTAAEKAAEEKFARLEKIIMDERADREAREAAAKKLAEEQAAQAAADKAKAEEIAAAAKAAAAAATDEAEKKAAEELAKAKASAEEEKKAAEEAATAATLASIPPPPPPPEERKKPIKFKDAVGRKFSFPFHLCNTWMVSLAPRYHSPFEAADHHMQGMEDLIRQAFLHVEIIGPHVAEGHYDLVGPNGEIILPQVWETMIEPDWTITMHMWPMPEPPTEEAPPEPPPEEIIVVPDAPPVVVGEGEAIPAPPSDEPLGEPPPPPPPPPVAVARRRLRPT